MEFKKSDETVGVNTSISLKMYVLGLRIKMKI